MLRIFTVAQLDGYRLTYPNTIFNFAATILSFFDWINSNKRLFGNYYLNTPLNGSFCCFLSLDYDCRFSSLLAYPCLLRHLTLENFSQANLICSPFACGRKIKLQADVSINRARLASFPINIPHKTSKSSTVYWIVTQCHWQGWNICGSQTC